MITVKLDREFEKTKEDLLQEGISALSSKLAQEDITKENLGLFLYTKDVETLEKDATKPWEEMLENYEIEELKKIHLKTTLWLTGKGFKTLNRMYPTMGVLVYLWNFQTYWGTLMSELENARDKNYYKPSMLQWALYLTIRGETPKDFPKDCHLTYAIKRWKDIRELNLYDVQKLPKAKVTTNKPLQLLRNRLKELHTSSETELAKLEGSYETLKAKRAKTLEDKKNLNTLLKTVRDLKEKGKEVELVQRT